MELFKNTLFINLEQRTDRLEHVLAEFDKMNITAERVNAVKLQMGNVGCTMSHIKCLELAKSREYEYVFICEDDITFNNPELLKQNLSKFYENNDIMWEVLIIGGNNVPPYQQVEDYCARILRCQTTTGYVVKSSYYDTLISNFKESAQKLLQNPTSPKLFALDIYWNRLQMRDFWYMIIPPTVTQYESYSDIEEKTVNYDFLMLDMDKPWYVEQQERQKKMILMAHQQQQQQKQLHFM
jgi:GR25 family glycosyltransferase involved in LPS biosynthesis